MAEPPNSASQPQSPEKAGEHCRFLGACNDPTIHFGFPTSANRCHTEKRPYRLDLSYQESHCLSNNWARCPRYRAATGQDAPRHTEVLAVRAPVRSRLTVWALLGIIAAAGLVLFGMYLGLVRLLAGPRPSPTAAQSTQALVSVPTSLPVVSPTPSDLPRDTPTGTSPPVLPTDTPTPPRPTETPVPPTVTATPLPPTGTPPPPTETPAPATDMPTPTPSRTPVPSPRPTRPAVTPTDISFPAPTLLAPLDGQRFFDGDEITLEWQSIGTLPRNVFYVPIVAYSHQGAIWTDETPWTRDTRWTLSEHHYLLDLADQGMFRWTVQVWRKTGEDKNGRPVGRPVSPEGEERSLYWMYPGGGEPVPTKQDPTKEPPPP